MRVIRLAILATSAVLGLGAAPAAGSVDSLRSASIGTPFIRARSGIVTIPVTVVCDVGWKITGVAGEITQRRGRAVVYGLGSAALGQDRLPCTGQPQTVMTSMVPEGAGEFRPGKVTTGFFFVEIFFPAGGGTDFDDAFFLDQELHVRGAPPS
jgi:hypothetical protein